MANFTIPNFDLEETSWREIHRIEFVYNQRNIIIVTLWNDHLQVATIRILLSILSSMYPAAHLLDKVAKTFDNYPQAIRWATDKQDEMIDRAKTILNTKEKS